MRVVVTGATGNVGTSVLTALAGEPAVESVVGLARRVPELSVPKVDWRAADVTRNDLTRHFAGADAVVHLVWIVQPNHDEAELQRVNVGGSLRVLDAVADAAVPVLVSASAFGAYSGGAGDLPVDESWPTHGIPGSWYSRQKAYVERALDAFELANPHVRVVRFRSALILKREASAQAHRLYGGPLLPRSLVRPSAVRLVADVPGLRVQAVHSRDVGDAYRRALVSDVRGAFNLAAAPVLDAASVAAALGARTVPVPARAVRGAVSLSWLLRLQPTSPDWVDLLREPPLLDARRAKEQLGWAPSCSATEALLEFLEGVADGAGTATPPLAPFSARGPRVGAGAVQHPAAPSGTPLFSTGADHMSASDTTQQDAIELLTTDHNEVEQMFQQLEFIPPGESQDGLISDIIRELSVHAAIEEQVLYPAMRKALPDGDDLADEAIREHQEVKEILATIESSSAPERDTPLRTLIGNVRHHVQEEESELFPKLRAAVGQEELQDMGAKLAAAKKMAPTHPHPKAPNTPPGNIVGGVAAKVMDKARDALGGR